MSTNVRKIRVEKNVLKHAEGSCMFQMGNTKVLCVATVSKSVPPFAEERGEGWVTAEYSMLPRAGKERSSRQRLASSGRTKEISRLVGRALRAVVDLKKLYGFSVMIDCDVIQADGGTRTTSVNGAFIVLVQALRAMVKSGELKKLPVRDYIAAVSAGYVDGKPVLDLCAKEDNNAEVDMNFVITGHGKFVEVQGTGEKNAFTRAQLNYMLNLARKGVRQIIKVQKRIAGKLR
ncbi:MAG: ribonuclease PH [Elusimicrobiota bacterium]